MPENEEAAPAIEAQQEAAQSTDAKPEATSTAKASDEISEDDLEAVAGGAGRYHQHGYKSQVVATPNPVANPGRKSLARW